MLGDAHGNVVHLFERECSVQRRFQKIVEETPSPALDARPAQARSARQPRASPAAANYRNAGTVEFIFGKGEFYFLEMNTRLQVEHPVTEMVTGIDLVREQMRVAAGEKLGFAQHDVASQGHAIEFRIYAESPARGFTPTTGKVAGAAMAGRRPACASTAASSQGQPITSAFDPMLAKLIVHGARPHRGDRPRRRGAVATSCCSAARPTRPSCAACSTTPAFAAGEMHTGFLDANPELAAEPPPSPRDRDAAARRGARSATRSVRDAADAIPPLHAAIGGWRN